MTALDDFSTMYEGLLDKAGLAGVLKEHGLTDEEVEAEWQRLLEIFDATLMGLFVERMPADAKQGLLEKYDENSRDFAEAAMEWIKTHLDAYEPEEILVKARDLAMEEFLKLDDINDGKMDTYE